MGKNEEDLSEDISFLEKNKKVLMGVGIGFGAVVAIYLGVSFYFSERFLLGSEINSISVAGQTVSEANTMLNSTYDDFEMKILGRGISETVKGKDIGLKFKGEEEVKKIQGKQSPFSWLGSMFSPSKDTIEKANTYDKEKFNKVTEKLDFFKKDKIEKPKEPKIVYSKEKGEYVVEKEELGNIIDQEKFRDEVGKAITRGEKEIDLEKLDVYKKPKFTSTSKEVEKAKTDMNKMVNSEINYEFSGKTYNLDKEKISTWLSVDKNMKVKVDERAVGNFAYNLAIKYNTVGASRNFKTSGGSNIQVSGGNYGHAVDQQKEKEAIIELLKTGDVANREPIFSQKGKGYGANDIGDNYVEISLGGQHIWFYKNGQLITEGQIVTGNVSRGWGTPPGVYKLTYKERNATLRGDDYETPVDYWMPFNGGIGLHDAKWRNKFGGNIYQSGGSHGCVNLPHSVAQTIFNNIDESTTIVLYY